MLVIIGPAWLRWALSMKRAGAILLLVVTALGGVLGLPLLIGIWLPDVFVDRQHILAEQRLANGHSFRVIQYWNHGDFYNTGLVHIFPNGAVETSVLDADDDKTWHVPLAVNEQLKTATIVLGGGRVKTVEWQ